MQVNNTSVHEFLSRLRLYFQENDLAKKYAKDAPPLRAELFNINQLEQHGKHLARTHQVKIWQGKERLLKRLAKNEQILVEVRKVLTDAVSDGTVITPAGEWLLDNFYLIEEHIRTGKRHLPKGYSQGLPRIVNPSLSTGLPRVYDIAVEIISHTDGRIDRESLSSFIKAYQAVTPLQLGELWAIPIMLRLALIENLRRVSTRIAIDKINQSLAGYWATLMTDTAENDPKNLILVIADMARSVPPMESSFVAELIRQLMWKGPTLSLPLTWMEQRLSESGLTSNELVNMENQKQAADQVSISNSIGSLRFLGAIEWREFVETMSVVEHTLREDASGVYANMDFSTRDRYRHIVEKIAKYSQMTENEVAATAVQFSKQGAHKAGKDSHAAHVGYYLIGAGHIETEQVAMSKPPFREILLGTIKRSPLMFYVGVIVLLSFAISGYLFEEAANEGAVEWLLIITALIAILGASHLATTLVNWLTTMLIKPELLPRLDFSNGIPAEYSSMVIVPTMLVNPEQVAAIVEAVEVRFLANRDRNLHFGILTDFTDANQQVVPEDQELLELAKLKIEALNLKYAASNDKFFIFHRPRKWNPFDKIWMGYERKRGKLTELNRLLRGNGSENFLLITGDTSALKNIKYIITLDSDTQLPRDAAWKLVGTMAHPLNTPYYDVQKKRITRGYGILQPRVSVSFARSKTSLYALMHGNEPGIDPYTRLTSDVYQDLFEEGSFIGKGIYDIDAFEKAIAGRFPENHILSHDLLEGCYTRSGLLSDVQFYEEYPSKYSSDVNRRHRWIRGDWQIARWCLPFAPDGSRRMHKNTLSALSRWKIFDNLRRSLVPAALTALLILGWTVLGASWFWTIAVIAIIMLPSLIASVWNMFRKSKEITLWQHILTIVSVIFDSFFQDVFWFACLPYEAWYSLDAIARTGWRMMVSHKKRLEWNPSGSHESSADRTVATAYRAMWISPFTSASTLALIIAYYPLSHLIVAGPVLMLWALSPLTSWWISRPLPKFEAKLTSAQITYLRRISRKTWAFFEKFVIAGDNWLPVDNYQERPNNVVAHRTSPTNIGLALLANLSAFDFGYITPGMLIQRTTDTFNTLKKMERYQGHFYNWYDTISLKPLHPKYISTVDSGNLAGHLLTLKQGLLAIPGENINTRKLFGGLLDTISILDTELSKESALNSIQAKMHSFMLVPSFTVADQVSLAEELLNVVTALASNRKVPPGTDAQWWLNKLLEQCTTTYNELITLFGWSLEPIPGEYKYLLDFAADTRISDLAELETTFASILQMAPGNVADNAWIDAFKERIRNTVNYVNGLIKSTNELAAMCEEFADLNYEFLYDRSKNLLTIGYNVDDHLRDSGCYDLLASEARLCSFVAIAQNKLPQETWFALGRLLTNAKGAPILLSWSGSMFEYLMPLLVMPDFENTLLHQTHKSAVARQIEYGAQRNVPWGISESGYNLVDTSLNYQYRAFGVPGLGLKRGLAEDLVIAPYASVLALMVAPEQACRNMERLSAAGFEGRFGFYEAIDYTPSRVPRGQQHAIIQSFMAHHQGMSLLSIAYVLLDQPMQKRFEAELQFQATMLLLQERIPKTTTYYSHPTDIATINTAAIEAEMRVYDTPNTPIPEVQLLSNGRYHVMITNAGGGYSKWKDIAVTRWREDTTCDNWGTFCYIRDVEDGTYWSNAHQPTLTTARHYEATFTQGRAEFRRRDNHIETQTEIVVSPEDDIEMRRIHITNRSRKKRIIEVTTYAEVVLTSPAADAMHPAFSNLFIQTEIDENRYAVICKRRPRSAGEHLPSMFHMVTVHGVNERKISYETDRLKFIGRGNTLANPAAMATPGKLSNSQGAVLDPIVSIRYELTIEPEDTIIVDVITGVGNNTDECLTLIDKYQDKHHKDRVFELAWTHSQVLLRQINATEADAQHYGRLASSIIYHNPLLRGESASIIRNVRGQSGLWGYSVSGDLPIVLLEIEDQANIELAKQLVQAHAYWRLKGLAVDLVIWNEDHGGYRQVLQNQILGLIAAGTGAELTDHPGGIFVRSADQISNEDRILFQTVARINISDKRGSLEDHLNRKSNQKKIIPEFAPTSNTSTATTSVTLPGDLLFFNGTGGFSPDGKEYVIFIGPGINTPAPWVNVLANPGFGTVISESGQSYTWITNAHEFRLTPWGNDPICDKGGEVFYLRDEDSGNFWSPTLLPACGSSPYITRHGFGYSIFEHSEQGIDSKMTVFTDIESPVKFFVLKIKNASDRQRRISVTGFVELVLGDLRPKTAMHIVTETDPRTGALYAKNAYNTEFAGHVVFFDTDDQHRSFTADRSEFIGRNGSLKNPAAMAGARLSGRSGAALDPCAAIQSVINLGENEECEVIFRLGAGKNMSLATDLIERFRGSGRAHEALRQVKKYWQNTLNKVQVETPDIALNLLANGWLMYQTIACRLWGRSGYYQSGGAYGYRDQLQDILAVIPVQPALAREQILLCASRQFKEGDVQHWWHPPTGRGVRTRCSDDLLWLPFATCTYVMKTGDTAILDEQSFFLDGRLLNVNESSYYDLPVQSELSGSLYDHCVRAVEHALKFGVHGLPLIGHGDWNDGMDLVGKDGKGESIWLAFLLYDVLNRFAKLARERSDNIFAEKCNQEARQLQENIEKNGWDGNWYRRAYFDDGTPLGSASNVECRIDSISQSWAILSGAGDPERTLIALANADKYLVRPDLGLIQLLDPPFDKSALDPGYIKGYVPGIRENGGQYTHAAVWMIMAHAALGNTDRAWELLNMINPINHAKDAVGVEKYKIEPYVSAADVYSVAENSGRGGWTWYTGSAGWMYQLIMESLLGISQRGDQLRLSPRVPAEWKTFKIDYLFMDTIYHITFEQNQPGEMKKLIVDGLVQKEEDLRLTNDKKEHNVVCQFVSVS